MSTVLPSDMLHILNFCLWFGFIWCIILHIISHSHFPFSCQSEIGEIGASSTITTSSIGQCTWCTGIVRHSNFENKNIWSVNSYFVDNLFQIHACMFFPSHASLIDLDIHVLQTFTFQSVYVGACCGCLYEHIGITIFIFIFFFRGNKLRIYSYSLPDM